MISQLFFRFPDRGGMGILPLAVLFLVIGQCTLCSEWLSDSSTMEPTAKASQSNLELV
jgi:hypothetical protein